MQVAHAFATQFGVLPVHAWQAAPPVPHADAASVVWHVLPAQQPAAHEAASHLVTHAPLRQIEFEPHAVLSPAGPVAVQDTPVAHDMVPS